MLKKFAILGLLLFFGSVCVLVLVVAGRKKEQQEAACYQSRYGSESDEYLKQYNEWLQLTAEKRADFAWEINKPGSTKTEAQLRHEQRERLKADLDKLAAGQTDVYPFANVLYGDNWQKELSKYRSQRELKEFIVTGSIVCTSAGGAIVAWCSLLWTARLLIRVLSCPARRRAGKFITDILRKGIRILQSPEDKSQKKCRVGSFTPPEKVSGGVVTPPYLDNTLMELTQEVAAIRKYASGQQDRVKKLQEGYDWNIIRNFCLRIIRCIDHLENRIEQLGEQDAEVAHLKEVRDELLFALESSGVEQFEPEINSDYCELKKYAEAIKERQFCDSSEQTGKVAQVIRPGYQYFIGEENTRVVRTAQVKLYGELND